MAFRHGKTAVVTVNAVDLSTFCNNLDFNVDVDTADTTTFGSTWKSAIAGVAGGKLSLTGDYDGTVTTGPSSALLLCIAGAVPVAVVHKPGGTLTGQRQNAFNALVTSFSESSPVGGVVTFKADLLVTGAVTSTTQ
jgi:hypothetical protein